MQFVLVLGFRTPFLPRSLDLVRIKRKFDSVLGVGNSGLGDC